MAAWGLYVLLRRVDRHLALLFLLLNAVGVLIWFLQAPLLPAYPVISYPAYVLGFVAEVGLAFWLLVKGVGVVDTGTGQPG